MKLYRFSAARDLFHDLKCSYNECSTRFCHKLHTLVIGLGYWHFSYGFLVCSIVKALSVIIFISLVQFVGARISLTSELNQYLWFF